MPSNRGLFQATLLLVLCYTLLELVLRQLYDRLPDAFHTVGIILVVASTPWSLLGLELFRPVQSHLAEVARDFTWMMVMCVGVAVNAVLLKSLLTWIIALLRRS